MESEYQTAGGAPADPAAIVQGKDEIGIVEQIPFDSDRRLPIWKAQMDKRLTSYGWVDRAKGIIHVPVERAMQEVVDQAAAAPPPGGGAKK
jgi:hypothetical protein